MRCLSQIEFHIDAVSEKDLRSRGLMWPSSRVHELPFRKVITIRGAVMTGPFDSQSGDSQEVTISLGKTRTCVVQRRVRRMALALP